MQSDTLQSAEAATNSGEHRRVRVLLNRKSGSGWSFDALENAFANHWEGPDCNLTYAFTYNAEDGRRKAAQAVREGIDVLLVGGGDGSLSSMGACLLGSETSLGAIPLGSGNGMARHFGFPMSPEAAIKMLARSRPLRIDAGLMNGKPFLMTCSMAWDAALTETFERSPIRGVMAYVLAGIYRFFEYTPHPLDIVIDDEEPLRIEDPMLFTIANLSQFGGGVVIAPDAAPDDGILELIAIRRRDAASVLGNLDKVWSHRIAEIPRIVYRRFRHLLIKRPGAFPIQMDGECFAASAEIEIRVLSRQLKVLVPPEAETRTAAR